MKERREKKSSNKVKEINKCQYCGSSNLWKKEQWKYDETSYDKAEYTVKYHCEECKGVYVRTIDVPYQRDWI